MTLSLDEKDNSKTKVCVTGASGFIAGHVVKMLLDKGYQVRGTVRRPAEHYPHLTSMDGGKDRLELVQADLLNEGSFDEAVLGCSYVLHMASPYTLDSKDPEKDLVNPAVRGTKTVLSSAKKAGVVRVVLTSSMASISDEPVAGHVFNEDDWNEKSSLTRNPYYYSKVLAERAAWDFAAQNQVDLVVINPFMVIGPSLGPSLNTSNQMFSDMIDGEYPGIMSLAWGFVDVRDVAESHIKAMETSSASGRYLCANEALNMKEVVQLLKENGYDKRKLPKLDIACNLGDFAVKLISYTQPKGTGTYMRTHLGKVMEFDNQKIKSELGISFRDVRSSILDTVSDLEKWGHLSS